MSLTSSSVSPRNLRPSRLATGCCRPLATRIVFCIILVFIALLIVNFDHTTYSEQTIPCLSNKATIKPAYRHPFLKIGPAPSQSAKAIVKIYGDPRNHSDNISVLYQNLRYYPDKKFTLHKDVIVTPTYRNLLYYSDNISRKDTIFDDISYVLLKINIGHRGDLLGKGPYQGCATNKFPPYIHTINSSYLSDTQFIPPINTRAPLPFITFRNFTVVRNMPPFCMHSFAGREVEIKEITSLEFFFTDNFQFQCF